MILRRTLSGEEECEERLEKRLDELIEFWRGNPLDDEQVAAYYIDAYQTVRLFVTGKTKEI